MRTIAFLVWGACLLGAMNFLVLGKERLRRDGESLFLALAPRDPRSLVQGDYMALNYALANQAQAALPADPPRKGRLVVKLDDKGIADFARFHQGEALAASERALVYRLGKQRWRGAEMRVGPDAFFFQEGHARYYERARYGELKVDASGTCLLVGLRGEKLEALGPER